MSKQPQFDNRFWLLRIRYSLARVSSWRYCLPISLSLAAGLLLISIGYGQTTPNPQPTGTLADAATNQVAVATLGTQSADSLEELSELEQAAFQAAVDKAARCVVQIETFGGREKVDGELVADGPTTGTIVGEDGWIISSLFNFRQQPGSILVALPDGSRAAARIVARDHSRELALLKVESNSRLPMPASALGERVTVGQWAIALGKTFDSNAVSQSVGIISAMGRAYGKAIQTDAKVSPVNYGGPLIDLAGRVIGILAPISTGGIMEGDSSQIYDSGIGFAVPFEDVLARLKRLQAGEDIHAGKLGVVTRQQNELSGPVRVVGATPGSPAAKSGVRSGDLIVAAGNVQVELLAHLRHALGPVDAGQAFRFTVRRGGVKLDLEATLAKTIPIYETRYLGLRADVDNGGARITYVEPSSPATKAGLQIGWVVTKCSEEKVASPRELRTHIAIAELDVPVKLVVKTDTESAKVVSLNVATWPANIPVGDQPSKPIDPNVTTQVLTLPLGDFPNKAAALVPSTASMAASGLLVVIPEPGEVDQPKFTGFWESFAKDRGWIVAYFSSANAKRWSLEESQLIGRVIGKLENSYRIDPSRTAVAGLGAGGQLALVGARLQMDKIAGVMTLAARLEGLNWREPNSPLQSLKFLFAGNDSVVEACDRLRKLGYPATPLPAPELNPGKLESLPIEQIKNWLIGLDRI